MPTYPLRDPYHAMLMASAAAMQEYGNLEQSLCATFTRLTRTEPSIGALIFFRIVNTRSRMSIIEVLLKERFYPQYNKFWNSLFKHIRDIDQDRNKISHWKIIPTMEPAKGVLDLDGPASDARFYPPNHWWRNDQASLSVNDVLALGHKCRCIYRALNNFNLVFDPLEHRSELLDALRTWHDIFLGPLPYPLPEDHLLYEPPPKYDTPPRSSRA